MELPIDPAAAHVEADSRFPSGPWQGFFLQAQFPGKNRMDLHLSFSRGKIEGAGCDWIGKFIVTGSYDVADGRCWMTKTYLGRHTVAYSGYNEGKGIWGVWEIAPIYRGGFHIWPECMGDPSLDRLVEEIEAPIELCEALTP